MPDSANSLCRALRSRRKFGARPATCPCSRRTAGSTTPAASSLLAPRLPGCEIVALDLAGHGLSDSRSPDSAYNIWQDVGDLLDVARRSSAGSAARCSAIRAAPRISMLFAATFPERVDKLILLEGGVPLIGEAERRRPRLWREALRERETLRGKSGPRVREPRRRRSPSARAASRRSRPAAAEMLARRSLREVPGGFQWHADQRLKAQSELRLTREHVRAFIAARAGARAAAARGATARSAARTLPGDDRGFATSRSCGCPADITASRRREAEIAERVRRFLGVG